jgi:hypothetical protein
LNSRSDGAQRFSVGRATMNKDEILIEFVVNGNGGRD